MRENNRRRLLAVLVLSAVFVGLFGLSSVAHADWLVCASVDVNADGQTVFHEDECQVWTEWEPAQGASHCEWSNELSIVVCVSTYTSTP